MSSRTTLLDDAVRAAMSNEKPALAQAYRRMAAIINDFAARAWPVANWVGGNDNSAEANTEPSVRRMYYPGSLGSGALAGVALVVPIADTAAVPLTGLTLSQSADTQVFSTLVPQTPGRREDINPDSEIWYPQYAQAVPLMAKHVSDYSAPQTASQIVVQSGESGITSGPQLRSGAIWQRGIKIGNDSAGVAHPVIGVEALPLDHYTSGSEIIGDGVSDRDVAALRDFANRLWRDRRIQIGWSLCRNGTGTIGISLGGTNYRYVMNPDIVQGAIAPYAPSATGPGIKLWLKYTAQGRRTTVRVYTRVYARMSGTTDTGSLGVYNLNDAAALTGPTAMTNGPTISGTSWAWYPSATSFTEATDPYFLGNASPTLPGADHVILCGRSSGATDALLIGGWSMCVRPSTA